MNGLKYTATNDTTSLVEDIGYWSGDSVFFNTSDSNFVILDKSLNAGAIKKIITNLLLDKSDSGATNLVV